MINFLEKSQVAELTGKVRYGAQIRALRQMGVDYRKRPDGRPIVLESAITPPDPQAKPATVELNLSSI